MSEENKEIEKTGFLTKVKESKPVKFVKDHKGAILGTAAAVVTGVVGFAVAAIGKNQCDDEWNEETVEYDEYDYTVGDDSSNEVTIIEDESTEE